MAKIIKFPGLKDENETDQSEDQSTEEVSQIETKVSVGASVHHFPKRVENLERLAQVSAREIEPEIQISQKSWTRQAVAVASLVFGLSLMMANRNFVSSESESVRGSRGLASVGSIQQDQFVPASEASVLKRLRQKNRRDLASIGTPADSIERLQYEVLDSRYRLQFEEGRLVELTYSPGLEDAGRPLAPSSKRLIHFSKKIFPVEFSEMKVIERKRVKDRIFESHSLEQDGAGQVGKVEIERDLLGHLYSMKFASAQ